MVGLGNGLNLPAIVGHERRVDRGGIDKRIFFNPNTEINLSANKRSRQHLANLHLLLTIEGSNACGKVERLTVERLHLNVNLFLLIGYGSFSVAGH